MATVLRIVVVLSMMQLTHGAYPCPSGYTGKTGTPLCVGAMSSSCSTGRCCNPLPTCAKHSAAWIIAQAGNGGCRKDSAKMFFDTKKTTNVVASPQGEAQIKAACCTATADAKCSDWAAVLGVCPAGKTFVGTNGAPPDNSDGLTLSKAKYHEMCCTTTVTPPKKCSSFSVTWAAAQLAGGGCAKGGAKMFFDLKKTAVTVASPAGEAQVKAACCTPFADAKCSDWKLLSCGAGTSIVGTKSAPPDNADGKMLSQAKYRQMCCEQPMKCVDYSEETSRSVSPAVASMVVFLVAIAATTLA